VAGVPDFRKYILLLLRFRTISSYLTLSITIPGSAHNDDGSSRITTDHHEFFVINVYKTVTTYEFSAFH
jgi:hypothetical protein